jgi:biotin carboxylase
VPQPASVLVGSEDDALAAAAWLGYPVVLKPRALAASLGVVKACDADELAERFAFASETTVPEAPSFEQEVLVEEFAEGNEISIDCAVHHGQVTPLFVARKETGFPPYFEEIGHYVDGDDRWLTDPQIRQLLVRTHAALGFTDGMTHCEVMLTATGPKVIEVNARLGGDLIPYIGLRATGIDPGLIAAAVACGRAPRVRRQRRLVGAVRFCYGDGISADFDSGDVAFPPEVDRFEPLVGSHHLSLFPEGTVPGRIAYITALAASTDDCRHALDRATEALDVLPHEPVQAHLTTARG